MSLFSEEKNIAVWLIDWKFVFLYNYINVKPIYLE